MLSLPITLLILLVAFGALVAAGVPLLLALTSVIATMALVAIPSQLFPLDGNVDALILLIGLAVGVDYSLFYMRREREERAAGRSNRDALEVAAATSGRAVLISGLTVIIAMAGMFITGDATFISFAVATITVVAVAMFATAGGAAGGARLARRPRREGPDPVHRPPARRGRASRASGARSSTRVMRRPVVSIVVAGGLLVALAIPALGMNVGPERLRRPAPGHPGDADLRPLHRGVPGGDQRGRRGRRGRRRPRRRGRRRRSTQLVGEAERLDGVIGAEPTSPTATTAPSPASRSRPRATAPTSSRWPPSTRSATRSSRPRSARSTAPRSTSPAPPLSRATSATCSASRLPLVFAFVLGLAFLLMLVTFRSIVIPIKAIVLNLLSVGAAYGVLVLVFQNGWGESLLGFESNGGVTNWLPLFLFVILFGLSMDYHVFILTRVREAYDRGMSTDDAVRKGIAGTRRHGDQRRDRDGRGVQRLRHPLLHRLQGDGDRPGGRDPDRRDDHPRRPAAGDDEAARRLELVPAELAAVAAAGGTRVQRGGHGAGAGVEPARA